jgi:hypothetical protein
VKRWWIIWNIAWVVSLSASLLRPAPTAAAPLPRVTVTTLSGQVVSSEQIPHAARWVLVYITPSCAPCEVALQAIGQQEATAAGPRIVVFVQGSTEEATALRATVPELEEAGWYSDPEGAAFELLRLAGVPTAIGIREQSVVWRVSGTLGDSQKLRGIVRSWIIPRMAL